METIHVGSWLKVDPFDIKLLRADINYTYIHFFDGSQVMVSTTIKKIQARLPKRGFLRVNRKEIINTGFVKEYKTSKDLDYLTLLDKTTLVVSRRRKPEMRQHFANNQPIKL